LHENYRRNQNIKSSSDRSFGIVFAILFAGIGFWPLLGSVEPRWWAVAASIALIAIAMFLPTFLAPFNRAWTSFGLLLHRIVSPLILALVFYLAVTPTGILMRLAGKDTLRTKFDENAESYWIPRDPPGPPPSSMKNQY